MTNCTPNTLQFSPLNRKKIEANFSGGSITSDGGLLLLREVDKRTHLSKTDLANAYGGTIRLKLFKIGAVILKNTRRVQVLFSSYYPQQETFSTIAKQLVPT